MSKSTAGANPSTATPVPSSPPPSESYFSEIDGTAIGSTLDTTIGDFGWEPPSDPSSLNIVSWKLGVDAPIEDGVGKRGFNAISTVLNHPTKKANPLRASRKPLPPLSQTQALLPKPYPASHYEDYLKTITPLYEQFVTTQQITAQSSSSGLNNAAELDFLTSKAAPKPNLPNLDTVPAAFFDPNYDLANPHTWAELMDNAPEPTNRQTRDEAIQDDLSTHLDNLERHLVHEITLRSTAFFSALSNLQDLNSESASCLTRISDLKSSLKEVGTKQAHKGLEIIDAQARLRELRITEGGVKRVAELDEILRVSKSLADGGDWSGALGCVEDVVRWWERSDVPGDVDANGSENGSGHDAQPHLQLTTLPALANLPTSIAVLMSNIASQLDNAMASVLLAWLSEAESERQFDKESFRLNVGPMLFGLQRCGRVDTLSAVWRNAVSIAIREGSRQHLPVSQAEDDAAERANEPPGQTLAHKLQAMDHREFLQLSRKMYASMLGRLRLSQEMGEEMAAILIENSHVPALSIGHQGGNAPSLPAKGPDSASFDPADVLASACELANTRASKILSVRSEQTASLPIEDFVEIFNESWQFVTATELLAKRMLVSLRGVTASQARSFLVTYHGQRLTKSARLVEEETWVQVDVVPATQDAANLLVEAALTDPPQCFIPPRGEPTNGSLSKSPTKLLKIDNAEFCLVKATSESLQLLGDYVNIVVNLELVVTDVMSRIIEFLKSFNSRTCQVVLGAGAMRSAGLKNITAKHLALASQSLSAAVALIPYIREFLRRHLNPKQAVMLIEFDKLKRDYLEHQNEIHAKLVAIMADRLAVHCGELRGIDWEVATDKDAPHQYAMYLAKETATLHKVLSKYLAKSTVEGVMSQVLAASVHRLSEEYSRVELKSEEGKQRMLVDAGWIATRIGPLSESGSIVKGLETLVREKPTPRKPVGETMKELLRNGSSSPDAKAVEQSATEGQETPNNEGTSSPRSPAPMRRGSLPGSPPPKDGTLSPRSALSPRRSSTSPVPSHSPLSPRRGSSPLPRSSLPNSPPSRQSSIKSPVSRAGSPVKSGVVTPTRRPSSVRSDTQERVHSPGKGGLPDASGSAVTGGTETDTKELQDNAEQSAHGKSPEGEAAASEVEEGKEDAPPPPPPKDEPLPETEPASEFNGAEAAAGGAEGELEKNDGK